MTRVGTVELVALDDGRWQWTCPKCRGTTKARDPQLLAAVVLRDHRCFPDAGLPALEEPCPCRSGIVQHPAWARWWETHETQPNFFGEIEAAGLVDLDEPTGVVPEEVPCPECHGSGQRPTAAGRALLDFLARHRL